MLFVGETKGEIVIFIVIDLLSSQFSPTSHVQFVPGVCPADKVAGAWRLSPTPCSPGFEYGKDIPIPSLCACLEV